VRPKEPRVQTGAGDPLADQAGILSRRDRSIPLATAAEEKFAGLFPDGSEVIVDRLSGLFRHLELDRLARLLLPHGSPIDRKTMRSDVLDAQAYDVTSSKLAIDGQVEHR
jgi:hypothetical protein